MRATIFNYACHPTTLAWENRLLSPRLRRRGARGAGAARTAPRRSSSRAPRRISPPRDDYVGDTAVADRNGRQLGYAAAAAIEGLPPPGSRLVYTGIVPSGANLGKWEFRPCSAEQARAGEGLAARLAEVELNRKEDLGVVESLTGVTPDPHQEREKALRRGAS